MRCFSIVTANKERAIQYVLSIERFKTFITEQHLLLFLDVTRKSSNCQSAVDERNNFSFCSFSYNFVQSVHVRDVIFPIQPLAYSSLLFHLTLFIHLVLVLWVVALSVYMCNLNLWTYVPVICSYFKSKEKIYRLTFQLFFW